MYVIYEGPAAVPGGFAYVVGGATLLTVGALFIGGVSFEQVRAQVLARPALALVPVGAAFLCQGLAFFIGFVDRRGSPTRRFFGMLFDAPTRLGGLILMAWGAVMLSIGVADRLAPAVFLQWFESMTGNPWPFA